MCKNVKAFNNRQLNYVPIGKFGQVLIRFQHEETNLF